MITNVCFLDPRSQALHHFDYVDNLGVLAMEESQALAVMGDLDRLFPERGLLLHEASCGIVRRESLGTILDCARHATMLTPKRFHRLYQGIRAEPQGWLLKSSSVTVHFVL